MEASLNAGEERGNIVKESFLQNDKAQAITAFVVIAILTTIVAIFVPDNHQAIVEKIFVPIIAAIASFVTGYAIGKAGNSADDDSKNAGGPQAGPSGEVK